MTSFCSSKYNDKNQNVLSRIQITMGAALNKEKGLPKFIIVFLDSELINYLDYTNCNVASMLGPWLEWLATNIREMIDAKKSFLPGKTKRMNEPAVYWNMLPLHHELWANETRAKYNEVLETVLKTVDNMRVLKLKEVWDPRDNNLVVNNKFTVEGISAYWRAVDTAFKFNAHKREIYLAKEFLKSNCV